MNDIMLLSRELAHAREERLTLDRLPPESIPADAGAAYAIQQQVLQLCGARIGGWKVGAKSPTGPVQRAMLPHDGIYSSGARVARDGSRPSGLELEIAFCFERVFTPRGAPYSDDDVRANIGSMAAAVEIVASRYADWPNVDKLAQLADLQNHGALIVGTPVPYRDDFPFAAPTLQFAFDGRDLATAAPANPAGDPRRLLTWLVNHCTQEHGIELTPEMIVTTGSYTGMSFPDTAGTARGRIDGLGAVEVTLF